VFSGQFTPTSNLAENFAAFLDVTCAKKAAALLDVTRIEKASVFIKHESFNLNPVQQPSIKFAPKEDEPAVIHRLQAQYCGDESEYDLSNIKIWRAWLSFKSTSEIESHPLVQGAEHFLVPPCLLWNIKSKKFV
jgi:hypothetical protein